MVLYSTKSHTQEQIGTKLGNLASDKEYVHLITQWHPTKNGNKTPANTASGSGIKIWWKCEKGHEWDASPLARTRQSQGCPICSNKRILTGYNDLATTNPELASQWHPSKNSTTPQEVFEASNQKVWWLGSCSHEWEATINSRKQGNSCPYCGNRKVLTGFNDLASRNEYHHIVRQWDYAKNTLKPTEVSPNSNKKAWWVCENTHSWEAIIANRTRLNSGCPKCKRENLSRRKTLGLISDNPKLLNEWHPDNKLKPSDISEGSDVIAKWICSLDNNHIWETKVSSRRNGSKCPICAGTKIVPGENDLASHAGFEAISMEWDIERNTILPSEISAGSQTKVFWKCSVGHQWEAGIYQRITRNQGCPTCAGRYNAHLGKQTVADYPQLMEQWHSTNTLVPTVIPFRSTKPVIWECPQNHVWEAAPYKRSLDGSDCPVCAGRQVIVGANDLASHPNFTDIASEWHEDNEFTPQDVTAGSNKSALWKCSANQEHVWAANIYSRVIGSRKKGCPFCASASRASRGEREVASVLEGLGIEVQSNVRGIIPGELDMYIPSLNAAVEFNGLYWHSEAVRPDENYHANKYQACKAQGITLFEVWEDDWNLRRDLVVRFLAERFGVAGEASKVLPELPSYWFEEAGSVTPQVITLEEAQDFFDEHHVNGFVIGTHFWGLKDSENRLRAALVTSGSGEVHISRYAVAGVVDGFASLLSFVEESIDVARWVSDVEPHMASLYESNGFIVDKVLAPDFSYFVRGERVHKSNYPVERFSDDSGLLWEDGLSERELAKLNGIHRIWDSGKVRFVKEI